MEIKLHINYLMINAVKDKNKKKKFKNPGTK